MLPWAVAAFLAAGVAYLGLAGFVWANHRGVASRPLVLMLVALKIWALCYAVELASDTVAVAQWWSALKFIGVVLLPPGLWAFVLEYTGRGPMSRRVKLWLSVEPVIVLTMLGLGLAGWTRVGDLIHSYGADRLYGQVPVADSGNVGTLHAFYTYALMLGAVTLLATKLVRIAPAYRRQGVVLMVASLLPFFANAAWLFVPNADDRFPDPTPLLFGITALVMVWGFFRLKLLDVTPVARGIVMEQMRDGVIVLDVYDRVIDANPAAARLVGGYEGALIGRKVDTLLPEVGPLLTATKQTEGGSTIETELTVAPPDPAAHDAAALVNPPLAVPREVAVSITPVNDQVGRRIATLVELRDVTERNRVDRQVRTLLNQQTRIADTLRQSLRPVQLPPVPGLRLSARWVPSIHREGAGDFYDVHLAGGGNAAFVLGDVSGKGVQAAAVTALARYTVRTLSSQGLPPSEVLQQLNRALLATEDPERFCTVVYGHVHAPTIDLTRPPSVPAPSATRVRLTLALGGHPLPLVRRRDRTVQFVGRPGTALGLLPDIDVTEVDVDLAAGDLLVAYTDGVTEARRGSEQFGEERLAAVVADVDADYDSAVAAAWSSRSLSAQAPPLIGAQGTVPVGAQEAVPGTGSLLVSRDSRPPGEQPPGEQPHPAATLADTVADAVLRAVKSFSPERDDVALLVLEAT